MSRDKVSSESGLIGAVGDGHGASWCIVQVQYQADRKPGLRPHSPTDRQIRLVGFGKTPTPSRMLPKCSIRIAPLLKGHGTFRMYLTRTMWVVLCVRRSLAVRRGGIDASVFRCHNMC